MKKFTVVLIYGDPIKPNTFVRIGSNLVEAKDRMDAIRAYLARGFTPRPIIHEDIGIDSLILEYRFVGYEVKELIV